MSELDTSPKRTNSELDKNTVRNRVIESSTFNYGNTISAEISVIYILSQFQTFAHKRSDAL